MLILLYFIFSNATAQILGLHVDSVIYLVLLKVTDTLQIRTCDALHNFKLISMHLRAKLKAPLKSSGISYFNEETVTWFEPKHWSIINLPLRGSYTVIVGGTQDSTVNHVLLKRCLSPAYNKLCQNFQNHRVYVLFVTKNSIYRSLCEYYVYLHNRNLNKY